uniref:Uncharacterized protein n=1 Tax=Panagrolaimus superbus TaxID=310955 RepID=A0A914YKD9_9BILA
MIWQNRWFLWLLLIFPLIQAIFQFTPYVLTFSSLVLICSTCLAAIFNTLTFLKLYLVQHADNIKRVKEMNLMIVSFVIFIAQVLRSSFDVCLFLGDNDAQRFMFTIFPILQCIFAISGSISMLTLRYVFISFCIIDKLKE